MSETHEVINLIGQDDTYANLYVDLVKKSTDILDSYFWLKDEQTFELAKPLVDIRDASTAAVDEFDKVARVRNNTARRVAIVVSVDGRNAVSGERSHLKPSWRRRWRTQVGDISWCCLWGEACGNVWPVFLGVACRPASGRGPHDSPECPRVL